MPRINLYHQGRHVLIVDGAPLSGFADGDFIQVKEDGNAAQRTMGGDGPAMNISVAQGGQITIGLMPTSPVIGVMYALREAQRATPRLFSIILMTGTEEVVNAAGCGFADLPQWQTGGDKQQARQFAFECLQIRQDTSALEAVAGGFLGGLI